MEHLSFLANLLLIVTIGTLMVALIAYMAYKMREMRRPQSSAADTKDETEDEMVFLRPYVVQSSSTGQQKDSDTLLST